MTDRRQKNAVERNREGFADQTRDHQVHGQSLHREDQLLDEIAVLQHHARRAAHGLAESEPRQHSRQEVKREIRAALFATIEDHAEDEEVSGHQ